jgi:hypothetical protein
LRFLRHPEAERAPPLAKSGSAAGSGGYTGRDCSATVERRIGAVAETPIETARAKLNTKLASWPV